MRTAMLLPTSMLLAASVTLAGPDSAGLRAPGKPLAEVPFTLHQNAIILDATIDGREKVRLLLDTRWGPLALVSTAAKRLGLQPQGQVGELPRVEVESLAIGLVVRSHASFEVFPVEELEPLIGPHDGILSTAFFKNLVLQVDYPAGIVRFYASSPITGPTPTEPGARASVPMVFSPQAGALPFTDSVLVDGKPARALFDTGGAGGFMAMQPFVDRARLESAPNTGAKMGIGMLSNGHATQQPVQFVRVERVAIGSLVVDSPRVMVAPAGIEGKAGVTT